MHGLKCQGDDYLKVGVWVGLQHLVLGAKKMGLGAFFSQSESF